MILDFLKNFGVLFSLELRDQRKKTLQKLRREGDALNAQLDVLKEMEDKLKDANM